jgi:hypothetical protein
MSIGKLGVPDGWKFQVTVEWKKERDITRSELLI